MVSHGKKSNVKLKRKLEDYLNDTKYNYYYDNKYGSPISHFSNHSVNCSDYSDDDEFINRLKGAYIREHITREPTPVELEWIKEQEKVTDPKVLEDLRPALEWLQKYVYCKDDKK